MRKKLVIITIFLKISLKSSFESINLLQKKKKYKIIKRFKTLYKNG